MGPWVQMAVFCFDVEEERGQRWPVGPMNEALFPPMASPGPHDVPVYEFEAVLFVTFVADGAAGPLTLQAYFSSPLGQTLADKSETLEFVGDGIISWYWPLSGQVGELGTYWAEIRLGEQTMTRVPLEFRVLES